MTPTPISGLQTYGYARNNPLAWSDPNGLQTTATPEPRKQEIYNQKRCANGESAYCYTWGQGDFVSSFLDAIDHAAIVAMNKIASQQADESVEYSSTLIYEPSRGAVESTWPAAGDESGSIMYLEPRTVGGVHTHNESPPVPSSDDLKRMEFGPAYIGQKIYGPAPDGPAGRTSSLTLVRWDRLSYRHGMTPAVSNWQGGKYVNAFHQANFRVIFRQKTVRPWTDLP